MLNKCTEVDVLPQPITYNNSGCLQVQPNKFPVDFQDAFSKVPVDFLR